MSARDLPRRVVLVCVALALGARDLSAADAAGGVTYKQVRIGKTLLSLPNDGRFLGPEVPVWIHLHGAPAVLEGNFAAIGAPGVLVNLTLPGLSKVYADYFADPRVFPDLLRDIESALREASAAKQCTIGRLTVSSFSAGFGGVRQLLRQADAFDRIDALVMADSIYCGYASPNEKRVDEDLMMGFLRFARLATEGKKRMVISHSRQIPEGYASTTETADFLIAQLRGERKFATSEAWPNGLRELSRFSRGDFEVIGFDGDAPEDHLRHLRAIGALLQRTLPRN